MTSKASAKLFGPAVAKAGEMEASTVTDQFSWTGRFCAQEIPVVALPLEVFDQKEMAEEVLIKKLLFATHLAGSRTGPLKSSDPIHSCDADRGKGNPDRKTNAIKAQIDTII